MKTWLYKWLPIVFGCHCRADRSFFYKGSQFPVCARCTGLLAGFLVGIISLFISAPPVWLLALFLLPMVADGLIQRFTPYESGNIRRFITGLLFGFAALCLFCISIRAVYLLGHRIGSNLAAIK